MSSPALASVCVTVTGLYPNRCLKQKNAVDRSAFTRLKKHICNLQGCLEKF